MATADGKLSLCMSCLFLFAYFTQYSVLSGESFILGEINFILLYYYWVYFGFWI